MPDAKLTVQVLAALCTTLGCTVLYCTVLYCTMQVLAALCTTLGCLLNGAAIAYTGPAIPSLTNITGDPNDGGTVWGGDIRVDAQEASWIGTVMRLRVYNVLGPISLQRACCR